MIDDERLPATAALDTGVFLRGVLGDRPDDPRSPACMAFCDRMLDLGRTLFVGAPTIAEVSRYRGSRPPRTPGILVIPFDNVAAEFLGLRMPQAKLHSAKEVAGASVSYWKYDSMIIACARRSKAPVFITLDAGTHPLAADAGIACSRPEDFFHGQGHLPFT